MNWRMWLHGLVAAAIGAAANIVPVAIVDPTTFNVHQLGNVAKAAGISALVAAALYLKQSPLPGEGGSK